MGKLTSKVTEALKFSPNETKGIILFLILVLAITLVVRLTKENVKQPSDLVKKTTIAPTNPTSDSVNLKPQNYDWVLQ